MLAEEYRELSEISMKEPDQLKRLPNVLLIGGWAAHFLSNERYREWKNADYVGSKDIDFGVRTKDVGKISAALKETGFSPINFRFYKAFDRESKRLLANEQSKAQPLFRNFYLYVDIVLDEPLKGSKATFFHDDLIRFSFENRQWVERRGFNVIRPEVLLLIKLRILENRNDEKRLKDMLDCLFVSAFSNVDIDFFKQLKKKFPISKSNLRIAKKALNSKTLDLELTALRFDAEEIRGIKVPFMSLLNTP